MSSAATMVSKYRNAAQLTYYKRIMKVYCKPDQSSSAACQQLDSKKKTSSKMKGTKDPSRIPVFRLPKGDPLTSIPEEAELHWGFFLNMSLLQLQQQDEFDRQQQKYHKRNKQKKANDTTTKKRRYKGLMSLSNTDRRLIEKSATTAVEFRCFARFNTPIARAA